MAELNADQEYSYSDEQLMQMVREATAAQRAARGAWLRRRGAVGRTPG